MRPLKSVLAAIGSAVLLTAVPATAQQPSSTPAVAEPGPGIGEPRSNFLPVVGVILDHAQELGLSSSQMEGLERLGLDIMREAIRRQADLMIAQVDAWALLDRDPDEAMDVASASAKIRETAQIRTDLEIAFVRGVEAAKSQLTPDQRSKLTALLRGASAAEDDPSSISDPPSEARAAGSAPPGGTGGRPPAGPPPGGHQLGGRPPAGHPPGGHQFEGHRHFDHRRVFIGGGPFWWGVPYPYWPYPAYGYAPPPVAVEPPQYIQPAPPTYWYYCQSAQAYYPSVPTCPEPWVLVAPAG